jgi:Protein of unknown function (DUF1488)
MTAGLRLYSIYPVTFVLHGEQLFANFTRWAMEIIELEPSVSADGRAVIFQLSARGRDLECAVTCEALEQHFWLQRGAGEARILKAFADGRKRITAVAERKILARPGEKVLLTINDFAARC